MGMSDHDMTYRGKVLNTHPLTVLDQQKVRL